MASKGKIDVQEWLEILKASGKVTGDAGKITIDLVALFDGASAEEVQRIADDIDQIVTSAKALAKTIRDAKLD